jgi:hypothetical protein
MEMDAPRNGANEKYALVRAVPRCLNASMKQTRLMPYPANPTAAADAIVPARGHDDPSAMAIMTFKDPATRPLIVAS